MRCTFCGKPYAEQDESRSDTFWIKAGAVVRQGANGETILVRCGHCGKNQETIDPTSETPTKIIGYRSEPFPPSSEDFPLDASSPAGEAVRGVGPNVRTSETWRDRKAQF